MIRLRPIKTAVTDPSVLATLLKGTTSARDRGIVVALLQRYGTTRVTDLRPEQREPFTAELQEVLSGRKSHPADSSWKKGDL